MADPLQFAQQLAHQTSAATNQYRAQGADIGGPIARGLQAGIGIGMNFEEFELKQAMAEAQVQENQMRMANMSQEIVLRQGLAKVRMMESQEKMMEMDLAARDKAEGRSLQRERLKLEARKAPPIPLANGKFRMETVGSGGQASFMDVDADHPAMQAFKGGSRGDGTVKYEPAYKDLIERESALSNLIKNNKTFAEDDPERMSPEQIAETESELADVKGRLREMAKSPGARGKAPTASAGAGLVPPQQSQNAQWVLAGLRRDATAKLEMDDQQLEAGLDRVARLMRAAGQDLDPVTGEPVSKETLMVNILSQAKRDDDDGRALADILRKAARQ